MAVIGTGLAASAVVFATVWFAFHKATPPVPPPALSSTDDALDAFSADGIFEVLK